MNQGAQAIDMMANETLGETLGTVLNCFIKFFK